LDLTTAMRPISSGCRRAARSLAWRPDDERRDVSTGQAYNLVAAPELGPIVEGFLTDPVTTPRGGEAAAASKVS
jgi:hypothetical protein